MNYTTTLFVQQTPDDVYAAINDVGSWWTGDISGPTDTLGGEFTYRYEDKHRSTQRVTELVPDRRVVWLVTDAHLPFASNPTEWTGTHIVFDINEVEGGTEMRFEHQGLIPELDCYSSCSNAWASLVTTNLKNRITGADA